MLDLDKRSIAYLPGVGPKKADILQKEAGIPSYEDLLFYFPYRYMDRSRFYKIAGISGDMPYIRLRGQIFYFDTLGERRSKWLVGKSSDGAGTTDLVWFKGLNYMTDRYRPNTEYIVFEKPTEFGHTYNIPHPDIDSMGQTDQVANGLTPFYDASEKMKKSFLNSRAVQSLQYTLLNWLNWEFPETLFPNVLKQIHMMSMTEAMRNIHFPESATKLRDVQLRLKFDKLFFIQLNMLHTTSVRKLKLRGVIFPTVGHYSNTFYKEYLPFELTNAQKRIVREIRIDVGSRRQVNRLLQGDVGSSKTSVGLLSMLLAMDNHCQVCMMAPTEILATQRYATIMEFLKDMDMEVAPLTGSIKKKERDKVLPAIASGKIQTVIGTYALIKETVVFSSLGLAIINEQHRFGIEQRSHLWMRSVIMPHVPVMTATPIPHILTMTLHGNLDVSVIDELPSGRKPIQALRRYDNKKAQLYGFLRKEIQKGHQVYVVYPLIEGSEKLGYKDLEADFETFKKVFPEYKACMVHDRMKTTDKDTEMQKFISGEAQILVATTIIEVGVNVPNASVMMIENVRRLGLSRLHQLRSRVGRGVEQSCYILVSSYKLSNDTRKRLGIMVNSTSGFEIAKADLRLQGHGDLGGTQQGDERIDLKIVGLVADGQILQYARDVTQGVPDEDPKLLSEQHRILSERLKTLLTRRISWETINQYVVKHIVL